ncbi:XRE family transcriptional regulator [Ornithobacterium rhinotracheale]|uniref:helix-turn-helix domain-containing protein n=1 Tax=Ornithobacterium rhinotracheale TaxID=28251 RepID=UPI00129C3FE1|nr:helix-turn-helix transcriptional regulator [Ornithobacterium rhinotracheale]MRJ09079.1 XRE family transcriptional regulator [Ornithobacterium rhinotracheale]UOH77850.1 helix-turn-helix transcriptional regulator [Ornithobacterium rhinotracheale]
MILRLQEILEEKNITSKDLSEMADLSQVSISNILNGKSSPKIDTINKIATVLKVPITALFVEKTSKIQLIIDDNLHTFYSLEELKEFIQKKTDE